MTKSLQSYLDTFPKESIHHISLALSHDDLSKTVTHLTSDSRDIRPGTIFVAIQGNAQDGHQYISQVEKQGALLMVGEKAPPPHLQTPYLKVPDTKKALAQLAAHFYDYPSEALMVIGITGTSGKTTTTYLMESILQAAGHQVGLIGTVNYRYGSRVFPSHHTTPGAMELQRLLLEMKNAGCTAIVMEVSSHALKQHRTAYIAYDGMIFTNLSPEHLDYHPDMEDYFQAKALLFTESADFSIQKGKHPVCAINADDPYGQKLIQNLKARGSPSTVICEFKTQSLKLQVTLGGVRGELQGIPIESKLTGQFNCSNISASVGLSRGLAIDPQAISEGITRLSGVPGRLERIENPIGMNVWIDYAHKPDALEKVLNTLREICHSHRLITVFGCGGDRDKKKRPVMGKIAVLNSDHVFITSDNPRTEDPTAIIQEILQGTQGHSNFTVEVDRKKAIFRAIEYANPGDLVIIAGKGHEDYQILGTRKIHFDDKEVAQEALHTLRKLNHP